MNTHELELLADYAAGVLDDTPTGASVARRIAADPGWADSYAALVAADATVRNALTSLRPVPMPATVADRLATTLAAERPGGAASAEPPGAAVLPLRPRRRRAWQAGGAVAAGFALLAAGALGWQTLRGTTSGERADTAAPASSGQEQKTFGSDSATGSDYTRAGLPGQVRQLLARPATREDLSRTSEKAAPDALATGVDRLRDPAALAGCVRALGLTGTPLATDFGRYEGKPALVLVLPGATPATLTAVVVGPDCGLSGPDELQRATVTR